MNGPILVTGASGRVGRSTLRALSLHDDVKVRATTKSSGMDKLKEFKLMDEVDADGRHNDESLHRAFEGISTAIIILPSEARSVITHNFISQAKSCGLKHVVVLSARVVGCAGYATTRFGRQFKLVEDAWKGSGIPYTIVRLPFFLENQYANVKPIKTRGEICYPVASHHPWSYISVEDAGKAFAAIAIHPENHVNETYGLNGPDAITCHQLAEYYSECLRKDVKFRECANWDALNDLCEAGVSAWKAEGLVELWELIEERAPEMSNLNANLEKITGSKGISCKDWIQQHATSFK